MVLPALVAIALTPPAVTITPETYRGWPAFRATNGQVDLVVVPAIGRAMWFGFKGTDRNLLWENSKLDGKTPKGSDYANYGGDRLWIAPQSLWGWPPEPAFDGAAWEGKVIENGIRITSQVGTKYKVRLVRDFTLDLQAPKVKIRNRLDNLGPRMNLALWQLTQVIDPDNVILPFEPSPNLRIGWTGYGNETLNLGFQEAKAGKLVLKREKRPARKFGSYSKSGKVSATFGSTLFESTAPVLRSQSYPEFSPLQVFMSADPNPYAEVAHTSPIQPMQTRESAVLDVEWNLSTVR